MTLKGSTTVLVVDDEPQVRQLVTAMLAKHGYEVFSADSGENALALFRERHSDMDIVLTDVAMPGMTGPQMVQRMLSVKPSVCVIFMSGYSPEATMPEEYLHRFALVSKPFTFDALVAAVRNALHGGCGRAEGGISAEVG